MNKHTIFAVALGALAATGTMLRAQQIDSMSTIDYGGGMTSAYGTTSDGDSFNGTTIDFGGVSSTHITTSDGDSINCSTIDLGNGMTSTSCQ